MTATQWTDDQRRRRMALLQDSPDLVFWMTPDGSYVDVHSADPELLAVPEAQIVGTNITDALPTEAGDRSLAAVRRVSETGISETIEYDIDLPVGRLFFEARIARCDHEIVATVRDLTEQVNGHQRERAQSHYLEALLADAFDMIVTVDGNRIIQFASHAVETVLGRTPSSLVGKRLDEFVHPDEVADARATFINIVTKPGMRDPIERRFLHADGTDRTCEVVVTNLLHDPVVGGVVFHARDVTRRLLSQRRFRQLFETHPVATGFFGINGQGVYANPAYAALFGRSVSELRSMNAIDLVHPDAREAVIAQAASMRKTGQTEIHEYTFLRADNSTFIGQVTMRSVRAPSGDGGVSLLVGIQDITQWRHTEMERDRVTARLRATLDNSSDLITTISRDGTWSTNLRSNAQLGFEIGFERTMAVLNVVHSDDREVAAQAIIETFDGRRGPDDPIELKLLNAGGTTSLFEARAQYVPELDSIVATLRDVSEQRQVQAALLERERELAEANAASERAKLEARLRQAQRLESTGRLAAGVAHDFTNLLGVVLNYVRVLERSELTDTQRSDLNLIRESSTHAADLAQRLLRFGRAEPTEVEAVDLGETLDRIRGLVEASFGVTRSLACKIGTDASIEADRGQIEQVVLNLVLNARDAIEDGGTVTVAISADPGDDDAVILSVRDNGCGMSQHDVDRAFDPFFTTKRQGMGTGLGLSVVDGIVASSGGEIEMHSTLGEGTEIRITWPRLRQELPSGLAHHDIK